MLKRSETSPRMSQSVTHAGVVYLAGQVGEPHDSVADQTRAILAKIQGLLIAAGSRPDLILRAEIWLDDMRDFAELNEVWDAWVPAGAAPRVPAARFASVVLG